ncbi:hypothetical protein D3C80_1298270 [compost metagenome]
MLERALHGSQRMLEDLAVEPGRGARQTVEQWLRGGGRRQPGRRQQAQPGQCEAEPAE